LAARGKLEPSTDTCDGSPVYRKCIECTQYLIDNANSKGNNYRKKLYTNSTNAVTDTCIYE